MSLEVCNIMSKYDPKHATFLDSEERKSRLPPERLLSFLELETQDVVLDLGAGTGFLTFPIAEFVEMGKVYAVDVQKEMLDELEKKCAERGCENIDIVLSEEGDIPLKNGLFDKAFAINVLHEIEDEKTLEEIYRTMKNDAQICIVDWDKEVITERGPPTHERLTLEDAVDLLEEHGFTITDKGRLEDYYWMICKR